MSHKQRVSSRTVPHGDGVLFCILHFSLAGSGEFGKGELFGEIFAGLNAECAAMVVTATFRTKYLREIPFIYGQPRAAQGRASKSIYTRPPGSRLA
jgi:hypothetical protein